MIIKDTSIEDTGIEDISIEDTSFGIQLGDQNGIHIQMRRYISTFRRVPSSDYIILWCS